MGAWPDRTYFKLENVQRVLAGKIPNFMKKYLCRCHHPNYFSEISLVGLIIQPNYKLPDDLSVKIKAEMKIGWVKLSLPKILSSELFMLNK